MTQASGISVAVNRSGAAALWRDVVELTKPGIVRMVLITAALGFAVPAVSLRLPWSEVVLRLVACLVGVGAAAAAANAMNQAAEWERDALMERTRTRPIACGRRSPMLGWLVGLGLAVAGAAVLIPTAGPIAASTAMFTIVIYVALYTPLKPVTPLATIIGAIPGALPPVIGWSAAAWQFAPMSGLASPAPWALFLIMLIWQIPHVMALSWRYREEYSRAGYAVLPVVQPSGERTAHSSVAWSLMLVVTAVLAVVVMAAERQVTGASLLLTVPAALLMVRASVRFARQRDDHSARGLFLASLLALPLMLFGVVGDAMLTALLFT